MARSQFPHPAQVPRSRPDLDAVPSGERLSVAGLFAGIGGIELGLHLAGHSTALLCEIDGAAKRVLTGRFAGIPLEDDIRTLRALPVVDVVAAGFPCQDLSQAGRTAGIAGRNSSLVAEVFRLVDGRGALPRWLLLENVPFMLQLDRGKAMRFLTRSLEERGFSWAYRVVDARAFGLPQRRQRVIMLASRTDDPREILLTGDVPPPPEPDPATVACGFYWTEGTRGLGWAVDAVPTLKGGSTIGIPSPPAIRMPEDGSIVVPDIRDAERLQGFPAGWTEPAVGAERRSQGARWKLVGNAVSVGVARWVGEQLTQPRSYDSGRDQALDGGAPWPTAAWGRAGQAFRSELSTWPVAEPYHHLADFLSFETTPLSARATAGFLSRARSSSLNLPDGLLDNVAAHLNRMREDELAVA